MINNNRAIYVFKYLWDHTDEEHPATTKDIIAHLATLGISTTRKTVADDVAELQSGGFDIVVNRSRQNEYFIGSRHLEQGGRAETESLCGRKSKDQQREGLLCGRYAFYSNSGRENRYLQVHRIYRRKEKGV